MYHNWSWKVAKHKAVDIDINVLGSGPIRSILDIDFSWDRKTDHAGVKFHISVLGNYFGVMFYDTRHWDTDNNCWMAHDSYGWVETEPGNWEQR